MITLIETKRNTTVTRKQTMIDQSKTIEDHIRQKALTFDADGVLSFYEGGDCSFRQAALKAITNAYWTGLKEAALRDEKPTP